MTARKLDEELVVCDPPALAYWRGNGGSVPDQWERRQQ